MKIVRFFFLSQTYYWSAHAVDAGFAGSPFVPEQQFGTSPLMLNPVRHASGVFELGFHGTPGTSLVLLPTPNLAMTLSNWTLPGTPSKASPGHFQFTDLQPANHLQRFYGVRSPRSNNPRALEPVGPGNLQAGEASH